MEEWKKIFEEGEALFRKKKYEEARKKFSQVIHLKKDCSPYPYYYRGLAFKNVGKCSESIQDLSKAIQLSGKVYSFEDLHVQDAKVALDEVSDLQKKRVPFVQQFFACQDSVAIEKSSTQDGYEVFFLGKKRFFGGQKRSKVFEGSFKNERLHGEGVVFDQETGKELYKGIWDEGHLNRCTSERMELKTLLPVFQRLQRKDEEIAVLKKENAKLKQTIDWNKALVEELRSLRKDQKEREEKELGKSTKLKEDRKEMEDENKTLKDEKRQQVDQIRKLEKGSIQNNKKCESLLKKTSQENKLRNDISTQKRIVIDLKERNIKSSLKKIDLIDLEIDFLEPIGSGACADVLAAELKTKVALKRVKIGLVKKKIFTLSDVQNECKKIGCLNHKNVIKCLGIVNEPSKHLLGILTELGKESLESAVERKTLTLSTKFSFLKQLAEGMVFLHDNRIVHKDLNLRNVLIGFDGKIKIIDFGISKKMITMKSKILNTTIRGTPFFVAPETMVVGKNVEISKSCDVFSFGVVCYCVYHEKTTVDDLEVLFYGGNSTMTLAGQNQISKLLSDAKWKPKDPKEFDRRKISMKEKAFLDLVASCLQVLPQKRPSFKEIVVDLKRIEKLKDKKEIE